MCGIVGYFRKAEGEGPIGEVMLRMITALGWAARNGAPSMTVAPSSPVRRAARYTAPATTTFAIGSSISVPRKMMCSFSNLE